KNRLLDASHTCVPDGAVRSRMEQYSSLATFATASPSALSCLWWRAHEPERGHSSQRPPNAWKKPERKVVVVAGARTSKLPGGVASLCGTGHEERYERKCASHFSK